MASSIRKPIKSYLTVPEGWVEIPQVIDAIYDECDRPFSCCYFNKNGVQFLASVCGISKSALREWPYMIHVSLCRSTKAYTKPDWEEYIAENAPNIIRDFFGNGQMFAKKPSDENRPDIKHYFSMLD